MIVALGLSVGASLIAAGCVVVSSSFTTVGGSHNYAAEIQNHGNTKILTHGIQVDFLDADGNVVDSKTTLGCLRSLQPGASDFVEAPTTDSRAVSARASIIAGETFRTGTTVSANMALADLTLRRDAGSAAPRTLAITGTLKNNDSRTFVAPGICLVLRAKDGTVLRVNSLLTDIPGSTGFSGPLAGGRSVQFSWSMDLPGDGPSPDHVDAYADAFVGGVPTVPVAASGTVPAASPSQ